MVSTYLAHHEEAQMRRKLLEFMEKIKDFMIAILYLTIFFVDLLDAVVDLIFGFKTAFNGSTGSRGYGILTVIMRIISRILAGLYALAYDTVYYRKLNEYEMKIILKVFLNQKKANCHAFFLFYLWKQQFS